MVASSGGLRGGGGRCGPCRWASCQRPSPSLTTWGTFRTCSLAASEGAGFPKSLQPRGSAATCQEVAGPGGRCPLADAEPWAAGAAGSGRPRAASLGQGLQLSTRAEPSSSGLPPGGTPTPPVPQEPRASKWSLHTGFCFWCEVGTGGTGARTFLGISRSHVGYMGFTALYEVILSEKQREGDQLGLGGREPPSGLGGASSGLVIGAPA